MSKFKGLTVLMMVLLIVPVMLLAQTETVEKSMTKQECKLKIDNEKMLKIKKLELELQLKNLDLVQKKGDLHDQLGEEFMKESPSDKEIDRIFSEMANVHASMMKNRQEHMKAVRKILSAEEFGFFLKHGECCCGGGCGMGGGGAKGCMQGMGAGGCCEGKAPHMEGAGMHRCIKIEECEKKIIKE